MDLAYTSAAELAGLIRSRAVSPVEVMRATLERIERSQGSYRSRLPDVRRETSTRLRTPSEAHFLKSQPDRSGTKRCVPSQYVTGWGLLRTARNDRQT